MALAIPKTVAERLSEVEEKVAPIQHHEVGSRLSGLHQADGLTEEERKGAFTEMAAFNFMAMPQGEESVWQTRFGPMFRATRTDGTEVRAPDLADIDPEIIQYWERRSIETPHPVLRARYADLVWDLGPVVTKKRVGVEYAQRAIDSYIEVIERELYDEPMVGIQNAERALELAIQLSDSNRVELVRDTMFRLFDQIADAKHGGTWPFLFDLLYDNKKVALTTIQEGKIITFLEEVLRRTSDIADREEFDPWSAKSAGERLATHYQRVARRDEVERVVRAYGGAFEKISSEADGLLGMTWLQSTSEDYRRHGLIKDAERAQIAGASKGKLAPMEMKPIEVQMTLNRKELDSYIEALTEGSSFETLTRIARHFIPLANEQREALKRIQEENPLLARIAIERVGDGHIAARAGSIEEDPDGRLYFQVAESIAFRAPFLHAAFSEALNKKLLSADLVLEFLYQSPVFEERRQGLLKHGLVSYFAADYVSAIHVLVPQIEHALRVFLGLLGVPTNAPKRGSRGTMEAKTLGIILREPAVRSVLGEDLTLYFQTFLVEARGLNVRNDVSHGLLDSEAFQAQIADRVIHCLLVLGVFRMKDKPS